MSVLSLIQDHCRVHGLAVPSGIISNTDSTVQQLYGLLNELLDDMVNESKFNVVTREATFTMTAAEDQGAMATLAPYGCQFPIMETFYDRTLRRPLYGPLDEREWQQIKALPNPGPFYKFRIRGDHLLLNPVPSGTMSTIAFEYVSCWCVTDAGGTPKAKISADTDLIVFPDRIVRKGLKYRWKREKGLPYQADETEYYNLLNNYIARDKVKRRINLAHLKPTDIGPGVFVPSGSWMQ